MKKFLILFCLFFAVTLPSFGQSTTVVNLSIDPHDWNKLVVNNFWNKTMGVNTQIWYKNLTAQKRIRFSLQAKVINKNTEKDNLQLSAGLGIQVTSRKRNTNSYQALLSNDLQYKHKINKKLSFNARAANFLSVSPNAKQGDHTDKLITNVGFKYQKTNLFYYADYLFAFKTGTRANYQGFGGTYDLTKKITVGGIVYTDLKEKTLKPHLVATFAYKF